MKFLIMALTLFSTNSFANNYDQILNEIESINNLVKNGTHLGQRKKTLKKVLKKNATLEQLILQQEEIYSGQVIESSEQQKEIARLKNELETLKNSNNLCVLTIFNQEFMGSSKFKKEAKYNALKECGRKYDAQIQCSRGKIVCKTL